MNRCPTCGHLYDSGLSFCPADGTALAVAPTAASDALGGLLAQHDAPGGPQALAPAPDPPPAARSGRWMPVLAGVLGLVVVALLGLVLVRQQASVERLEEGVAAAEATAEAARQEAARLEGERVEAERLDAERLDAEEAAAVERAPVVSSSVSYTRTVWADSPGDGFLALRSAPNIRSGRRLLKIPHGAALDFGACLAPTTVAGNSGSWCPARYAGVEGWAFDAFVTY